MWREQPLKEDAVKVGWEDTVTKQCVVLFARMEVIVSVQMLVIAMERVTKEISVNNVSGI